ncbi:uncharacterized protein G2W53_037370 [Senna tora]|uniref:Uncharacterized protein n=1 Tax=Senna tora TaxID=362788 RepID=A0A834SVW0_9FABA|nr:uncharacterized protein G2W53_037370 [Senna tora]
MFETELETALETELSVPKLKKGNGIETERDPSPIRLPKVNRIETEWDPSQIRL